VLWCCPWLATPNRGSTAVTLSAATDGYGYGAHTGDRNTQRGVGSEGLPRVRLAGAKRPMSGYENVYGEDRRAGRSCSCCRDNRDEIEIEAVSWTNVGCTTSLTTSILATGTSARSAVTP
jgi:hypothetical protein